MAHTHDHAADDRSNYYLEQLSSIAACGVLGAVAVMMAIRGTPDADGRAANMLDYILAPQFHLYVMIGGIALLILVTIRAVTLWQEAAPKLHVHDHKHVHDNSHEHNHAHVHGPDCGHDHVPGEPHDHGWSPWRYAVLLFPIVLYFLNLPNAACVQAHEGQMLKPAQIDASMQDVQRKDEIPLDFKELALAASYADRREYMQGHTGKMTGMYNAVGDREFTLYRQKMTCCAADTILTKVRIISPDPLPKFSPQQWLEVKGQIQFRQVAGRDEWVAVLQLASANDAKPIPRQASEWD